MTLIHLENMERIAMAGAIVVPAMPAFYQHPETLDDIINHLVGKVLDLLGFENNLFSRWEGLKGRRAS
jgi:4-hydroxy-3-polyprenylbenzoate decarboxylase